MTDTEIVDRAAAGARDQRGRALVWVFVGVALAGVALLTVAFFSYQSSNETRAAEQAVQIADLGDRADTNAEDAGALAEQLRDLGVPPVVEPAKPGSDGSNGRDGADGEDGRDGADGADGQSPPCLSEPPQCGGSDGTDGAAGKDGTDGKDGTNGIDGQPGTPGPPPASWTWVDSNGRTQSCARSGGPDTAPTYECTAEPPAETVPGMLTIGG